MPGGRLLRALAGLAGGLCLAACDGGPAASDGSELVEVRTWTLDPDARNPEQYIYPRGAEARDVLSFTVTAEVGSPRRLALSVFAPDGTMLTDPERPEFSPNRTLTNLGLALAMIPSASASLPLRDNYEVGGLVLDQPTRQPPLTMRAYVKRALVPGQVPAVQDLPVTVFLVGAGLPDGGKLDRALDKFAALWRPAGVNVRVQGRVRLPEDEVAGLERLEIDPGRGSDSPTVALLLPMSKRGDGAEVGLPLFIVSDIITGPGASIWALAGGIPVPPVSGTVRSGVILNGQLIEHEPDRAGQVLAHEAGHAMGLYHTTEPRFLARVSGAQPGPIHDQIDDTPECPILADKDDSGSLENVECRDFDAGNLMFWSVTRSSVRLTAGQADIARRSAITR
jgi:hypothetical protein